MKVTWLCIGLGLAVLLFLSASTNSRPEKQICAFAGSGSSEVTEGFGLNIDFIEPRPAEMKMLAQSGVRWIRTDLKWDATETERGIFDFSRYEPLVKALSGARIRIVFILDYGNPLYDNGNPPRTEQSRVAFVRWSVAAASHFAGRGIVWELYNEPNHELFWPPKPNVNEYIALASAVGKAFSTQLPREQLIGPATSGIDFPFLEACFKAGLLKFWSAVSVHPYRQDDPETVANDYCKLRELIRQYAGQKQVAIFAGEWGYSAAWANVDASKQAQLLVRSWLTNVANGVELSIWYDWHDDGPSRSEAEHNFGIVSNTYYEDRLQPYDAKPAYHAVRSLTNVLSGYRFQERLNVGTTDDYVLLFRKNKETVVVAWSTASGSRRVLIPITSGRFMTISLTGENLEQVIATQYGLNVLLTQSPTYLRSIEANN